MIRVFKSGRHAHRTPLSYHALAPLFQDDIILVDRPGAADLYLFAHSLDVQDASEDLILDWRARRRPVVILSEEPFWDTIWGGRPLARDIHIETRLGCVPVVQLNHHTSAIFRFQKIPYYLLTNHRFINAYRWRFRRNAARGAAGVRSDFAARQVDLSFMFERRPERFHNVGWPRADIIGLCAWRTDLAEACAQEDDGKGIERLGQSWGGGGKVRQDLTDWHMDKITYLDGRARSIGALENTHQPDYLTEKFFDAFACAARPLYYASPGHRVHDLGLPKAAWLNLYGLEPGAAAARISEPFGTVDFFDAWHLAQVRLAALFDDPGVLMRERERLKRAVVAALQGLV